MLAVTSAKRVPSLPNVPTVAESGVPGYEAALWYGLLAPAGLPNYITAKIHAALASTFNSPDPVLTERLNNLGVLPAAPNSPDDFAAFLKADVAFWQGLVKNSGLKLK
jgi:tripartite-type tricarboxylate transporter receptor subunit TctC